MDNYRKIEIKGKGSYGQAMLVQHKQDRKFYIMKVIIENISQQLIDASMYDLKQKEDAINEVNMLKDLYHPCIIRYRESFVDKNRYLCIVMDYADEGTLDQKINIYKQNNEYMNEQQVLEWFTQMCLAVKYIHDKRIIHRDLKTQNIFIKANEIKLGDFGIAKMLQTNGLCKTSIGTPYFISPEVCQKIPYDTQSDIWSLGCILYEMMALRHAFDAKTMEGLFIKIIRGQYPPVPNHFSEDLKNLLAQMLTVEPEKRIKIDEILQLDIIKRQAQIYFNKIKPQQSIPDLIEKMRMELENILGFQKFVEVYTKTKNGQNPQVSKSVYEQIQQLIKLESKVF
ncbi:hypothetical protein pb186bvf_001214 [Paramecium bursaria]